MLDFISTHWHCTLFAYYIIFCILLLGSVAILTIKERQLLSDIQERKGPKKVGAGGSIQAVADGFKLMAKESIEIKYFKKHLFSIAAGLAIFVTILTWGVLPVGWDITFVCSDYTIFFIFNYSLFHIFALIFAGWSSFSKYAILGALRTSAQLIAYDMTIISIYASLFRIIGTLNANEMHEENSKLACFFFFLNGIVLLFAISGLAELNRHPFDLPEAESELVGGYATEYSSIKFATFFLSEYLNLIFFAFLLNGLFFGGFGGIYFVLLRVVIILGIIIFLRAIIPRYRYDQLMSFCWKVLLPIICAIIFLLICLGYTGH